MASKVKPGEWAVGGFVLVYMLGFTAWFIAIGNREFIVYIVTMVVLVALVARSLRAAEYPPSLLWALAVWGLLHMAGGGIPVNGSVLYGLQLVPITSDGAGEMTLLKYDQVVHFYGFAVTAWLLWHLMVQNHPALRGSWTAHVYPALGSMGLGCVNEIIEFSAVLVVKDTGVGGYYNTALDLVFNGAGAVAAMIVIARVEAARRAQDGF